MIFFLPASKRVVAAPGTPEGNYWIDVLGRKKLPLTLALWSSTFLTLALMHTMAMGAPSLMGARGISRADGAIIQMACNLGSAATGRLLDKKLAYTVPTIGHIILAVSLAALGVSPLNLAFASVLGFMIGIGTGDRTDAALRLRAAWLQRSGSQPRRRLHRRGGSRRHGRRDPRGVPADRLTSSHNACLR